MFVLQWTVKGMNSCNAIKSTAMPSMAASTLIDPCSGFNIGLSKNAVPLFLEQCIPCRPIRTEKAWRRKKKIWPCELQRGSAEHVMSCVCCTNQIHFMQHWSSSLITDLTETPEPVHEKTSRCNMEDMLLSLISTFTTCWRMLLPWWYLAWIPFTAVLISTNHKSTSDFFKYVVT